MCLFLYLFFCLLSGENLNTAVELVLLFVSDMSIFFFGKGEFKKKNSLQCFGTLFLSVEYCTAVVDIYDQTISIASFRVAH